MHRHLTPRSLERAQWLCDLLAALGDADRLLALLDTDGGFPHETERLRRQIDTVRSELQLLNLVVLGEDRVVGNSWPEPSRPQAAEG